MMCNFALEKEAGYKQTFWAFIFLILHQIFSVDSFFIAYSTMFFVKAEDNMNETHSKSKILWVCHKKAVEIGFVVAEFHHANEDLFGKAWSLRVLEYFCWRIFNLLKYPLKACY